MGLCLGPQNWANEAPGPLPSGEMSVDRVFGLFVGKGVRSALDSCSVKNRFLNSSETSQSMSNFPALDLRRILLSQPLLLAVDQN